MGRHVYSVLTVRQPWAALIVLGLKDVENRNWRLPEKYMGVPVLIHAAAKPAFDPFDCQGELNARGRRITSMRFPAAVKSGGIIGGCMFSRCMANDGEPSSPWCDRASKFWWHIKGAWHYKTAIPARGRLRFWTWEGNLNPSEGN